MIHNDELINDINQDYDIQSISSFTNSDNDINLCDIEFDNINDFDDINDFNDINNNTDIDNIDNIDNVKNPFYITNKYKLLNSFKNKKELFDNYKYVYILCCKDNLEKINNKKLLNFYSEYINFNSISEYFTLVLVSSKILNNKKHCSEAILVKIDDNIQKLNHNKYIFENTNEIIVPMFELSQSNVNIYKKLYEENDENDEYILKLLNLIVYYNKNNFNQKYEKISKYIYNISGTKYWCSEKNCDITLDEYFNKRFFNKTFLNNKIIMSVLQNNNVLVNNEQPNNEQPNNEQVNNEQVNNAQPNNAQPNNVQPNNKRNNNLKNHNINYDFLNDNNIKNYNDNISNNTSEKSSIVLDVKTTSLLLQKKYYIKPVNNNIFNIDNISNIFNSLDIKLHNKYLYDLFNNLLVSKDYCHLVLNNKIVLNKMLPIINKYYHMYRYLFGYAWINFNLEETINYKNINSNNRYVFDIDTLNKLPIFPIVNNDLHLNPYITCLIKKTSLNSENNILGLNMNYNTFENNYGVCDLQEFKKRFNIFTSGSDKINIFDTMDWDDFGISGSIIPACVQKNSELFKLIENKNNTYTDNLNIYYNHYYGNSDIDLMCKKINTIDFFDKLEKVIKIINKNLFNNDTIQLELNTHKSLCICINIEYIKNNLENINTFIEENYSLEELLNSLTNNKFKLYMYNIYLNTKLNKIEHIKKILENKTNILYKYIYENALIEHINIYVVNDIYDNKNIDEIAEYCIYSDNNKLLIKIFESTKIKIESCLLPRKIECFKVNDNSFLSTISRFHLPCVRGYYNGTNVYILPTCATAMLTGINIDYKYFASIRSPVEIINKYIMRGYGILLNDKERNEVYEFNKLNLKDIKEYHNITSLNINNKIFKPMVNFNNFSPDIYNNINLDGKKFNSFTDLSEYIKTKKNYNSLMNVVNTLQLRTINENGKINPLKKWIMEACYNN